MAKAIADEAFRIAWAPVEERLVLSGNLASFEAGMDGFDWTARDFLPHIFY